MAEKGDKSLRFQMDAAHPVDGASKSDPLIGSVFDQRYKVLALLGVGATGTVYKAHDVLLDSDLAIKLIHNYLLSNAESVERFKSEASTGTILCHNNIVRVYRQGADNEGRLYVVMDCVEGPSLALLIAKDGKLDLDTFFDLFLQIIDALKYAHEQGVVHRDLKPNNIIIVNDSGNKKALILDFGLAKWIKQGSEQGVTQTAAILGSSAYMSPEQCKGVQDIDERADIYSLGCIMLEGLLGRAPFQGESALDVMYKQLNESLSNLGFLKELPELLGKVIEKCLKKERGERYQSMKDLEIDFLKCSEKRDTLKRKMLVRAKQGAVRRSISRSVTLVVVTVLVLSSAAIIWQKSLNTNKKLAADYAKEAKALVKAVPRPENLEVPLGGSEMADLADQTRLKYGNNGALIVLNKWLQIKAKNANEEDRAAVYTSLESLYIQLHDEAKAEVYANKVKRSRYYAKHVEGVLAPLVEMYRQSGRPEKAIALIDQAFKDIPGLSQIPGKEKRLLTMKASLFMGKHDYKTAANLLQRARIDSLESPDFWDNVLRFDLITSLCILGQKKQVSSLIKECEDVARVLTPSNKMGNTYRDLALAFRATDESNEALKYFSMAQTSYLKCGFNKAADGCSDCINDILTESKQYKKAFELAKSSYQQQTSWDERIHFLHMMAQDEYLLGDIAARDSLARQSMSCAQEQLAKNKGISDEADNRVYIQSVRYMHTILCSEGKFDEAEKLLEYWISSFKSRAAGSKLTLASLYVIKANYLSKNKNYTDALQCFDTAMQYMTDLAPTEIATPSTDSFHDNLARALVDKAQLLHSISRNSEAIAAYRQALVQMGLMNGICYRSTQALFDLGVLLEESGKTDEADKYISRVENSWMIVNSRWTLESAEQLRLIAIFKEKRHDYMGAEKITRRCLDGLIAHYGASFAGLRAYYWLLGILLQEQEKYELSDVPLKKVIELSDRQTLKDSLSNSALHALWDHCIRRADYVKAEEYMNLALKESVELDKAYCYYFLAQTKSIEGKSKEAFEYAKQAIALCKTLDPPDPAATCDMQLGLVQILGQQKRFAEEFEEATIVTKLAEKVGDAQRKNLDLATALHFMGASRIQSGKPKEAFQYLESADKHYQLLGISSRPALEQNLQLCLNAAKSAKLLNEASRLTKRLKQLTEAAKNHTLSG